jgi:hypothetical protein
LEVDEKEIVNFDSDVYNQTVHNNDKGIGIVNKSQNSFYNGEKELFEKIIKDKDEEIAFLRGLVGKG